MAKWSKELGVNHSSRNPTAIANLQHDDKSLAQRNMSGSPGTYASIVADSTVATVVPDYCTLRVTNTAAAVAYLIIGSATDAAGTPSITTGIAIPPNSSECTFVGKLEDLKESVFVKASAATVQIAICEQ